ncbi:SDR family oxidoreductase [Streptomyces thinghirensis]|nr:SDR family oxidoreductase [Streptomyces thinghirensis]
MPCPLTGATGGFLGGHVLLDLLRLTVTHMSSAWCAGTTCRTRNGASPRPSPAPSLVGRNPTTGHGPSGDLRRPRLRTG